MKQQCCMRILIPGLNIEYVNLYFSTSSNSSDFSWWWPWQSPRKPKTRPATIYLAHNCWYIPYATTIHKKKKNNKDLLPAQTIHITLSLWYTGADLWFIQFADFIVKVWPNRADPLVRPNFAPVEVKDHPGGSLRKGPFDNWNLWGNFLFWDIYQMISLLT